MPWWATRQMGSHSRLPTQWDFAFPFLANLQKPGCYTPPPRPLFWRGGREQKELPLLEEGLTSAPLPSPIWGHFTIGLDADVENGSGKHSHLHCSDSYGGPGD